jgi:hypothetical protein
VWNDTRRDFAIDGQIEFVDTDREVTGVAHPRQTLEPGPSPRTQCPALVSSLGPCRPLVCRRKGRCGEERLDRPRPGVLAARTSFPSRSVKVNLVVTFVGDWIVLRKVMTAPAYRLRRAILGPGAMVIHRADHKSRGQ